MRLPLTLSLLALACLLHGRAAADEAPPPARRAPAAAPAADPFEEGLALFHGRRFAQAAAALERARRQTPDDPAVLLLLGISYYHLDRPALAEPLLRRARESGDGEVGPSARMFLGLLYQAQGATDRARVEIEAAGRSRGLDRSAQDLTQALQPRRLYVSLLLSPELDGNVALVDSGAFAADRGASADGDLLLVGSLVLRPLRRLGLTLGHTLTYRQQLRLQDYNLLHDVTTLAYSYLGPADRVRAAASFAYAMLGQQTLYLEGEGRAWYRRRLVSELGVSVSYAGRYRDYRHEGYRPFTGHTHTGQLELGWGLAPQPVSVSVGYQAAREELQPPEGAVAGADYRAWAHGPLLRLRARLHRRVELAAAGAALQRIFDRQPAGGTGRRDWYLAGDLSLSVACAAWLDAFAGATLIDNESTDATFDYVKPLAYAGVVASFAAL